MAIFNPLFDAAAWVLAAFYSFWPSYAGAIVLLTICVMTLLTPITIRSTKSMLAMRKLQPQVKRLQAEFRHDRQRLNEEMMALYRSNNANPLGGCLPLLMQSPIFIVLFQLLRGLTRRTSTLGHHAAAASAASVPASDGSLTLVPAPKLNFNPDYLNSESQLYHDLKETDEMRSWGLDLAETASSAISSGFVKGLPYIGLILLVGLLGYYQQRQISGRSSNQDQPPQARMMMKVIPIILPVISFGLPAGLVVYYVAQSFIRIGQQAFITRKYYKPVDEEEEGKTEGGELEVSGEHAASADPSEARPSGLAGRLGISKPPDPYRHGKIRPVSGPPPKPKPKPPVAKGPSPSQKAVPEKSQPKKKQNERKERKERLKKRRKRNEPPPKPTSSRVTPKGAQQRRRKKRRK